MANEFAPHQVATGSFIAQASDQSQATVNAYLVTPPKPPDPAEVAAAEARFLELPTDHVPDVANILAYGALRSPNRLFTGRDQDLKRLAIAIKGNRVAIAVSGIGGMGKTQLASEFAHRYGQFLAGGVFWLSFADADAVESQFAGCARESLGLRPDQLTLPQEALAKLVCEALQGPLPRLLIFDNCESAELLRRWAPSTGGSRVLVTSREPKWPSHSATFIALNEFAPEASREFLKRFATQATNAELDDIAAELGHLPLALHLAGSYLETYSQSVSPTTYLSELRSYDVGHRSLEGRGTLDLPTGHERDVARTFRVSFNRLDASHTIDGIALRLLARAACFAPGVHIPLELLRPLQGDEIDDAEPSILDHTDALAKLASVGLIERDGDDGYRLHTLIGAFARRESPGDKGLEDGVQAILGVCASLRQEPPLDRKLEPHLRAVIDGVPKEGQDEQVADLCYCLGEVLHDRTSFAEARTWASKSLTAAEALLGQDSPKLFHYLNLLGTIEFALAHYRDAKALMERALALSELTEERVHDPALLTNLATATSALGDRPGAESLLIQALEVLDTRGSGSELTRAHVLQTLAINLNGQRRHEDAKRALEQAQAACAASAEPDELLAARLLSDLGTTYEHMVRFEPAAECFKKALPELERLVGDESPHVANCLHNLAGVALAQERYQDARSYYQRALEVLESVFGHTHPYLAHALAGLGTIHERLRNLSAAESVYRRALAIWEGTHGPEHTDAPEYLRLLANVLQLQGHLDEAERLLHRMVSILRRDLGDDAFDVGAALDNLALVYLRQRRLKEAGEQNRKALTIIEQHRPPASKDVIIARHRKATILRERGKAPESVKVLRQTLRDGEADAAPQKDLLGPVAADLIGLLDPSRHRGEMMRLIARYPIRRVRPPRP